MDQAKREKSVDDAEKFEAARVEMEESFRAEVRVAIRAAIEGTGPTEPMPTSASAPVRYVQTRLF